MVGRLVGPPEFIHIYLGGKEVNASVLGRCLELFGAGRTELAVEAIAD